NLRVAVDIVAPSINEHHGTAVFGKLNRWVFDPHVKNTVVACEVQTSREVHTACASLCVKLAGSVVPHKVWELVFCTVDRLPITLRDAALDIASEAFFEPPREVTVGDDA